MSTDPDGREPDKPAIDQDSPMFAANPIWERSRKKKGFGSRKAPSVQATPEPRIFAERDDTALDTAAFDNPAQATAAPGPIASSPLYRDDARSDEVALTPSSPDGEAGPVSPIGVDRTPDVTTRDHTSRSAAPAAIAAGLVVLGALGATGWYMSRDDNARAPELTPGSATPEVATAPIAPAASPATAGPGQLAANAMTPPAAASQVTPPPVAETPRTSARTRAARVRPAAAPSASTEGVNASATAALPDGPQPYSGSATAEIAPTQVNPPLVILPPASAAPAAVPQSPATTAPEAAPTTETPNPATPQ